jgi:PAP2 superfamily
MSHFFASFVVAALLWRFAYPQFRRFVGLFVTLTLFGFATYALFPAAPPWLASQQGALPPTAKIIDEMWAHIGLGAGANMFSGTSHLANPVAAVPSIHAAYPFLLMLFFWRFAGRWRWLLPLYPLAMGFTLIYGAEHYMFDVLLGWLYATGVYVIGSRVQEAWTGYQVRTKRLEPLAVQIGD